MKKIPSIFLGLALTACATTAIAGKTFDSGGEINSNDSTQMIPISDNLLVIKSDNQGTITTADPENPLNGATGGCSGTMLLSMGKLTGGGYCTYTDADGNTAITSFTGSSLNDKGGNSGAWTMVGGTGKYIGATGGGDYSSTPNEDRTESVTKITGEIVLK